MYATPMLFRRAASWGFGAVAASSVTSIAETSAMVSFLVIVVRTILSERLALDSGQELLLHRENALRSLSSLMRVWGLSTRAEIRCERPAALKMTGLEIQHDRVEVQDDSL